MPETEHPIPQRQWETIVANVPLVSVDLVIEHDSGILLGKRENEPAKGEWFVPGGTVLKDERRTEALHRIAEEELGVPIIVDKCLGTYEHFYDISEIERVDSKHYLATAYRCQFEQDDLDIKTDDQHSAFKIIQLPVDGTIHPYVERYLEQL